MKKVSSFLLAIAFVLLVRVPTADAAYTFSTARIVASGNKYLGGTFPFTVAAWIFQTNQSGAQYVVVSGQSGGGGWALEINANACSGAAVELVKFAVADICSTLIPTANAWECIAAVVSSTQVHYVMIGASGSVSTSTISNSSVIGTPGSPVTEVSDNSGSSFVGTIGRPAVWLGKSLSDAEISAYCFQGPSAVGEKITLFYSMDNVAAFNQGQGNLGNGDTTYFMTGVGSSITQANNPPVNSLGPHH